MSGQSGTEAAADRSQYTEQEDANDCSSADLSMIQQATTGKGRLDSLRENLSKQQERLTALRERALRKSEDGGRRKPSMSDSMESLKSLTAPRILKPPESPNDMSTPTKELSQLEISGSEKLQMLNQRTEQNRALLEQRKRDMAKSLQSVKSGLRQSATGELGSSMSDLRAMSLAAQPTPVSRHRSAVDLQQQQQLQLQQQQQQQQQQPQSSLDDGRLKLLKNKMKLIEMKQSRKEQELQQELNELRSELTRRDQLIQQLESTVSQQGEQQLEEQEKTRLHAEIEQLRERNAQLVESSEMLETTRLELHSVREQLLEQQASNAAAAAASTDAQVNVELAKQLQELEKQLEELRSAKDEEQQQAQQKSNSSESERLAELEAIIEQQGEQLAEKTTELNVLNVNLRVLEEKLAQSVKSKPIFLDADTDASANEQLQTNLQQLKQKLDECNKSNIKLKLKCKQADKQLQKLQSTDAQQELARLSAENEQLQQRITVLEDEKGQWQLAHVEEEEEDTVVAESRVQLAASKPNPPTAGQTEAIRLLEEQKEELQQALEALQLGSETARVESELSEVQLEEQLSQRVQQLETEANEQRQQLLTLQSEKEALDKKLTHYINENMELLDKLEKLSSSSSAESIEIVERPSERRFSQRPASEGDAADAQATAEQDAEQDAPAVVVPSFVSELTQTDLAAPELEVNESLAQLRNESDELLQKIELFTNERREVLAKMEQLQSENATLREQLQHAQKLVSDENATLQEQLKHAQEQLQSESAALHAQLEELQRDKQQLSLQLSEKTNLSQELSSMQRSSEVVAALDGGDGAVALFDKCERSLGKLSSELDAYRKANDRNAKLNVSKKLAKEAKNVHIQLTELLHKVKEASTAVETVTVVETVVAVTAPNGKALAEYEQLTAQNGELKAALAALQAELDELRDSCEPGETTKLLAIEQEKEEEQRDQELVKQLKAQALAQQSELEELQAERAQLQSTLAELRYSGAEQLQLIASQSAELVQLQLQAERYDQSLNSSEMAHEKHMEQQQRLRHELQSRIETLEGEQSILQALVAEQKQQLIESYSESEHETNLKLLELQQCRSDLEASEARNKELREKLKKYALNLKKRAAEHSELEQQLSEEQATGAQLKAQVEQLQWEHDQQLESLQSELRQNKELQQQLHKQQSTLKEEVERLQVELQNTVHANTALRQDSYKLELALAEQGDVDELRRQLDQKSLKFDKSKEVIKHRNATIQSLQRELAELRAQLQAQPEEEQLQQQQQQQQEDEEKQQQLQQLLAQLQTLQSQNAQLAEEKASFELAIARLETLHEGIQAKLQQDQSYIETLETQISEQQAKNATLEDRVVGLNGRLVSANERLQLLEQQMGDTNAQQAEHETELRQRLEQCAEREQSQSRQLELLGSEAEEAREQLNALQARHDLLLAQHKQQTEQALAEREQLSSSSEQAVNELRAQLEARNQELEHQRNVYDAKLAAKVTELDELECDLSAHMERANGETRELTQQLERVQEQLQARSEEVNRLNEELSDVERERAALSREAVLLRLQQDSAEQDVLELQELRMQAIQDKTEIDNLRTQIDALCANHNQELQALQQQIAELDTLGQNQTDDQVYIETENKRLAEQLTELQARLDEQSEQLARQQHQHQQEQQLPQQPQATDDWMSWTRPPAHGTAQLQSTQRQTVPVGMEQNVTLPAPAMFFGGDAAAVPSPFDEIIAPPLRMTPQNLGVDLGMGESSAGEPTIEDLQRNVSDLEKHAKELETKLLARNQALAEHEERRAQLERLLAEREEELARLRAAEAERERIAAIEKLIKPPAAAPPTLDMFFGGESATDATVTKQLELGLEQTEPVVEPLITPKKAYLCQPEQEQQLATAQVQVPSTIDWGVDMDEDPWASAAAVEQPPDDAAMAALHSRIEELERQKGELQTKTAKLMKRLKEYRSKEQQQQEQTRGANNNDLDGAIIDELKHQLQLQELRQAKTEELLQQHASEKEKLAKRIDVLTAGNERMTELKERQDMDVQMYQARIRELQEKLQQLESWGETTTAPTNVPSTTAATTAATPTSTSTSITTGSLEAASDAATLAKIENLQAENLDLNTECQELQAQLQLEKEQAQRERDQMRAEQERMLQMLAEKTQHEHQDELAAVQLAQQRALQECQQLQLQLEELKAKQLELPATVSAPSDESNALLQEKEAEIVHLKQRIEELMREDQTEKLVLEILTKNQELQLLRMQVKQLEEDKLELHEKQPEPAAIVAPESQLELELEQVRRQCDQLQSEKNDMEEELRVLNNHVLSSLELEDKMKQAVLELDMKTIEITELRKTLELLQQAQQEQQQQGQQQEQAPDLSALNKQWEALVEQKCSEVASIWQKHLTERETALNAQIEQLTAAAQQLPQQSSTAADASQAAVERQLDATADVHEMVLKMQKALETQEMEIVTLKEQLAIRSAEYARLASQYDPFRLQNQLGGGGANGAGATVGAMAGQEPQAEYVLKSDLDYALMMLHQRDMRCEEMIIELVQLLEERDHLQLKLSDTLRQLEAERTGVASNSNAVASASASSIATSVATGSPNKLSISSGSDLAAATAASGSDLKQKLAELQTVKHSKDKAIVDEREQRLQQMIQLQRDMAKATPTAAAATSTATLTPAGAAPPSLPLHQQQQHQLDVDPSQTALRSPSMVFMDWILGNNKSEDDAQQAPNQQQPQPQPQSLPQLHPSGN